VLFLSCCALRDCFTRSQVVLPALLCLAWPCFPCPAPALPLPLPLPPLPCNALLWPPDPPACSMWPCPALPCPAASCPALSCPDAPSRACLYQIVISLLCMVLPCPVQLPWCAALVYVVVHAMSAFRCITLIGAYHQSSIMKNHTTSVAYTSLLFVHCS
jgi:hypothetical protein